MMYVEFMKNFLLADSSELMAARLILTSWAQKRLISYFLDMMYVEFMKTSRLFERADGFYSHFGLLSPKTFDSYFLDMMYVELMKNFSLANSSEMKAVRAISASWGQKRLIATFDVHRFHEKFSSRRFERADGS